MLFSFSIGLGSAFSNTATYSILGKYFPGRQLAPYAAITVCQNVGVMVTPQIVGEYELLDTDLPLSHGSCNSQYCFYCVPGFILILFIFMFSLFVIKMISAKFCFT